MLTIVPVTDESNDLAEIRRLYLSAFPANERRRFRDLVDDPSGGSELVTLYDGELFCGFACFLNALDISHIIYFAIEENLRDRGYGSAALKAIGEYKRGRRILVDIELETPSAVNNDQRRRRKSFYLRNGYKQTPVRYHWRGEDYEILSTGGNITDEEYENFWETLYGE